MTHAPRKVQRASGLDLFQATKPDPVAAELRRMAKRLEQWGRREEGSRWAVALDLAKMLERRAARIERAGKAGKR